MKKGNVTKNVSPYKNEAFEATLTFAQSSTNYILHLLPSSAHYIAFNLVYYL